MFQLHVYFSEMCDFVIFCVIYFLKENEQICQSLVLLQPYETQILEFCVNFCRNRILQKYTPKAVLSKEMGVIDFLK